MMSDPIDARGLSCPQPIMVTRKALQEADGDEVVVWVDTMTQVQNCTRAAESLGWQAGYAEKGATFELTLRRKDEG
jgi:tRNA 2-thiouridine synthesizing protein A